MRAQSPALDCARIGEKKIGDMSNWFTRTVKKLFGAPEKKERQRGQISGVPTPPPPHMRDRPPSMRYRPHEAQRRILESPPDSPFQWHPIPERLWADLTRGQGWQDDRGRFLFNLAYVEHGLGADTRSAAQETLEEYLQEYYDVYFDDIFDWDSWREYYDMG